MTNAIPKILADGLRRCAATFDALRADRSGSIEVRRRTVEAGSEAGGIIMDAIHHGLINSDAELVEVASYVTDEGCALPTGQPPGLSRSALNVLAQACGNNRVTVTNDNGTIVVDGKTHGGQLPALLPGTFPAHDPLDEDRPRDILNEWAKTCLALAAVIEAATPKTGGTTAPVGKLTLKEIRVAYTGKSDETYEAVRKRLQRREQNHPSEVDTRDRLIGQATKAYPAAWVDAAMKAVRQRP